jgi:hypothetical protein
VTVHDVATQSCPKATYRTPVRVPLRALIVAGWGKYDSGDEDQISGRHRIWIKLRHWGRSDLRFSPFVMLGQRRPDDRRKPHSTLSSWDHNVSSSVRSSGCFPRAVLPACPPRHRAPRFVLAPKSTPRRPKYPAELCGSPTSRNQAPCARAGPFGLPLWEWMSRTYPGVSVTL